MSNENKLSTAPAGAVAQKTAGGGALSVFTDGASFNTALRMAQCLASSTVVPKEYHGNVGNCMIAIEMASRINTSPMMVMQNLYIVNGRPAWSSQWIIAMINSSRRYKTELQFEFGRDRADGGLSCRAWAEDYSGHKVYGPKITMNMANDEGWTSKNGSKWKTMPDVMIQYRAASFFGRMNCPDMIMGIYSQEEVLDMLTLYETTGGIPDTLCQCVFALLGGECGVMGWIKTTKDKQQDRKWAEEDRQRMEREAQQPAQDFEPSFTAEQKNRDQ